MDTKVFIEKALKGEDYSTELETLTDDEKVLVKKDVLKAFTEEEKAKKESLIGIREAIKANEDKLKLQTEGQKNDQSKFIEDFKSNQITKAKRQFFSDPMFQFKDEQERQNFESSFNTDKADADLIFEELKKHYAMSHTDELLNLKKKVNDFEKGAIDINAFQANAISGGGSGDSDEKYSREAKETFAQMQAAGFKNATLDQAQDMVNKGSQWNRRTISD